MLGPSGCGKSTLLNALSVRCAPSRRFLASEAVAHARSTTRISRDSLTRPARRCTQGRLAAASGAELGGSLVCAPLGPVAYVAQEVAFFANLTVRRLDKSSASDSASAHAVAPRVAQVRETLQLAASLRRGRRGGGDGGSKGGADDAQAVDDEVQATLRRLGLAECAATLVVRRDKPQRAECAIVTCVDARCLMRRIANCSEA